MKFVDADETRNGGETRAKPERTAKPQHRNA
jgi:hypothetical protein